MRSWMWALGGVVFVACGDDGAGPGTDTQIGNETEVADTTTVTETTTASETTVTETSVATETVEDVEAETVADVEAETVEDTEEDTETAADTEAETVADTEDETVEDAATETIEDAATETIEDAATETIEDAATETNEVEEPVEENVLVNGSFELWSGGLPVGWVGTATNLATDAIVEDAAIAHDGLRSARLVNTSTSHKRFTSAPRAFEAGDYTCSYWVRGEGEIRNARYTTDYSTYSGYTAATHDAWREVVYGFSVAADVPALELIFSVRSTGANGLVLDDVRCVRASEICDTVTCESWQSCRPDTGACITAPGFCGDAADCEDWELCGADHRCALAQGACEDVDDCAANEVCDAAHQCVPGDPCADVTCAEWQVCDPETVACTTAPGRCNTLADCRGEDPVCDRATHTCVAIDAPANVIPNGGFEAWSDVSFGGATTYLLPDAWYGVDDGGPYFPETEINASNVRQFTADTHGGDYACQLVDTNTADRFTTERFTVVPSATYECAYWVRGHGTHRQRAYCGGWAPDTDFSSIDSAEWQQVRFELSGASSSCVLVLYASNTQADKDHLQFDDVVCIRK